VNIRWRRPGILGGITDAIPGCLSRAPALSVGTMLKAAALYAAGVLAAVALTGCGLAYKELSDDRTEAAGITEVRLEGGSGKLTVRRGESKDIQIHRKVRYAGDKPGATDHRDGSALVVNTKCGGRCTVDYTITVPAGVDVGGHNGSGDVDLTDVGAVALDVGSGNVTVHGAASDVEVRTGSGDIKLLDVKGTVTANAGSGNITLTRIAGEVIVATSSGDVAATELNGSKATARTRSGNVTLDLGKPQPVKAETSSGDIRLKVPDGSYQVTTKVSSGDTAVHIPTDPAGTNLLDLHTGSGNITVDKR
jgi:Putative adhesin